MKKMHYLDYAATCPVRPEIAKQYATCCRNFFVNPHGVTIFSEECRRVILDAERRLLNSLAIPEESAQVVWCSGGTEALNLAIAGLAGASKIHHAAWDATAHPAMLEPLKKLDMPPACLVRLPVSASGLIDAAASFAETVSLLCCCHVNNETGVIQDLALLRQTAGPQCIFCVDAVQSPGRVVIPWEEAHIDLMAVSARKIGGPPSTGALIFRRGIRLVPQIAGGGQQHGLRSGTLDTVSIRLFADSMELACNNRIREAKRMRMLNQKLRQSIQALSNGKWPVFSGDQCIPDIFSFAIPGFEGALVARILAEQHKIVIGTGSACSAETHQTSHVLAAMGIPPKTARCALRISLGYATIQEDLDAFLEALPGILKNM